MKRFTETLKWDDPWFRKLPPQQKLLWGWLLDRCDHAGVIEPDLDLAGFQIGYEYPMDSLSVFGDRVVKLSGEKFFIPKFIEFQYGNLSEDCRAHGPVFASLRKHGLHRVSEGYGYPQYITGQGQGQDRDKEEPSKARGTREEFSAYAVSLGLPEADGHFLHDHMLESGWKRGKEPIKDWKAAMRKWKQCGWLPSIKNKQPKNNGMNADQMGLS